MPKMKRHSGAKKRFKRLSSGRIKRAHGYRRHLLTKKSADRKRRLRQTAYVASSDAGHIAPVIL